MARAAASLTTLDRPGPVRRGEELPLSALAAWLHARGFATSADAGDLTVEQFPGGHSNLTYLLRLADRDLVLRRPPFGSEVRSAHDMGREYRVLSRLHEPYPKAPRALAACDDAAVLGAPFYVMERVQGVVPRAPAGNAASRESDASQPARFRALSAAAVDALVELHAVDVAAAGLADLGRAAGYVERQVSGWTGRWQRAATEPVPDLDRAAAWLSAHQPRRPAAAEESTAALLHNDFKYDNLVLSPPSPAPAQSAPSAEPAPSAPSPAPAQSEPSPEPLAIVAVLDWEMATVGEPLMDLGTSLAYWLDPDDDEALRLLPVGLTALPGNLRRAEVVERYSRHSGREVSDILFHYVFGLLKIAVIAQQIYFRYHRGLTADARFAALHAGVRLLGRTTAQAIARGRIDRLWD